MFQSKLRQSTRKFSLLAAVTICIVYALHPHISIISRFKQSGFPKPPQEVSESSALAKLCSRTKWKPELALHCHSGCGPSGFAMCGGLNNARNRLQTCIRLAIDAGATLVLPSIANRSSEHLYNLQGADESCVDSFWNIPQLRAVMMVECPSMEIRDCAQFEQFKDVAQMPARQFWGEAFELGGFRAMLLDWLQSTPEHMTFNSVNKDLLVSYQDSYLAWNYSSSVEESEVQKQLFNALTYNVDLLDISSLVLARLRKDDTASIVGIHLRVEADWKWDWGTPDQQMDLYTSELKEIRRVDPSVTTVYVSCGDLDAIERFRTMLQPLGFRIRDKLEVLEGDHRLSSTVQGLDFDRQGIVEYQTMVSAEYFLGIVTSTMSAMIAYARTIDDEGDFFADYIFRKDSDIDTVSGGHNVQYRRYSASPSIRGNSHTKLFVIDGPDVMDQFP